MSTANKAGPGQLWPPHVTRPSHISNPGVMPQNSARVEVATLLSPGLIWVSMALLKPSIFKQKLGNTGLVAGMMRRIGVYSFGQKTAPYLILMIGLLAFPFFSQVWLLIYTYWIYFECFRQWVCYQTRRVPVFWHRCFPRKRSEQHERMCHVVL